MAHSDGGGWKLETVELTERQKSELDALYDDMMQFTMESSKGDDW